jgi:hypothetical protein
VSSNRTTIGSSSSGGSLNGSNHTLGGGGGGWRTTNLGSKGAAGCAGSSPGTGVDEDADMITPWDNVPMAERPIQQLISSAFADRFVERTTLLFFVSSCLRVEKSLLLSPDIG